LLGVTNKALKPKTAIKIKIRAVKKGWNWGMLV